MLPSPLPFEQDIHDLELAVQKLEAAEGAAQNRDEIKAFRNQVKTLLKSRYGQLSAWETVLVSRHINRPQTVDYIDLMLEEFVELHGDRAFGDDRAIRTGFARIEDYKVMLIGHQKGRTLKERQECFYGCAHPEGYRKALSKMELAAKYKLPIVCLIDTPGAYPGIGAEERGQSQLIADSILRMTQLETPIVCAVIGEGGSGGALGIGVGDHVAMLQYAYYSVISPEGCAGILWKTANEVTKPRAAAALKLTGPELEKVNAIDEIIPEPIGAAHRAPREAANALKACITRKLKELTQLDTSTLLDRRYAKYRDVGMYL